MWTQPVRFPLPPRVALAHPAAITDPALKFDIHELAKMSEERRQAVLTGRMIPLPSQVNPGAIASPRTVSFRINPSSTTPPLGASGRAPAPSFYSERSTSYVPSFLQDARSRASTFLNF